MPEAVEITPDDLRAFRALMGWTQADLGERLGGSRRTVEDWEAGRRQPPAMIALALRALQRGLQAWEPIPFDHRSPEREAIDEMVRDRIEAHFVDRALTNWEWWATQSKDMSLPEALLFGQLAVGSDGYNDIEHRSDWDKLPESGWGTVMVVNPKLGSGLHPTYAFECRYDEHKQRLAVFIDIKRQNERLPSRLRVERALVDQGFRVMTFSGDEILADAEGCYDRISMQLFYLAEENLVAAGILTPPKRRQDFE